MHSLNHAQLARATAAEHVQRARRAERVARRLRPPPLLRSRVAHVAARLASRLDAETARRAI